MDIDLFMIRAITCLKVSLTSHFSFTLKPSMVIFQKDPIRNHLYRGFYNNYPLVN